MREGGTGRRRRRVGREEVWRMEGGGKEEGEGRKEGWKRRMEE